MVSEGTYVYLCDMKYDFSRWSKNAVDAYGLPSEYMYGAGDIWENHIHPDDRDAYHKGIDEIFSGIATGHDMQYRARRATGEYDVCTCRGVVMNQFAKQINGALNGRGGGRDEMISGSFRAAKEEIVRFFETFEVDRP